MQNQLSKLVSAIMGELKEISKTESIVGEPVRLGDKMVVPVTRLSLGFVVGGGEGQTPSKGSNLGGAGGGGAKVEPVGFIVIQEDNVSFLPTKEGKFEGLIDAIPWVIKKVKDIIPSKDETKSKKDETNGDKET
ncbi:MAG TPA: hypothetical protein ENI07_12860 [Desulfobacterales bacterium]|nr:hypothetical protein [Desulfobacterales bacterium]